MQKTKQRLLMAWPGLAHLWLQGSWAGLVLAIGFTIILCVLIASTFIWTAWLTNSVRWGALGLGVVAWFGSAVVVQWSGLFLDSSQEESTGVEPDEGNTEVKKHVAYAIPLLTPSSVLERRAKRDAKLETMLVKAQESYLQGDWISAERTLGKILSKNKRDIEARLLLATLCRHAERVEEAYKHLEFLERLEDASRWKEEIRQERVHLNQMEEEHRRETAQTEALGSSETELTTSTTTNAPESPSIVSTYIEETIETEPGLPATLPYVPKQEFEEQIIRKTVENRDFHTGVQKDQQDDTTGRIDAA